MSILIGGGKIPNSNLATFTHKYYLHYYGGVLPIFAHFYLGYLGVILLAMYLSILLNKFILGKCERKFSGIRKCIGIYITSTVPRWYLYSPTSITRGILIFVVVYMACYLFDSNLAKHGEKKI